VELKFSQRGTATDKEDLDGHLRAIRRDMAAGKMMVPKVKKI
jgi:hypothetical protein